MAHHPRCYSVADKLLKANGKTKFRLGAGFGFPTLGGEGKNGNVSGIGPQNPLHQQMHLFFSTTLTSLTMVNHKPNHSPRTPRKSRRLQRLNARYSYIPTPSRRRKRAPSPQTPAPKHASQPDTVQRAKIQGAHEFARSQGFIYDPRDIFKKFNVTTRTGYKYIAEGAPARTRHSLDLVETRGRKPKMSGHDVREVGYLLEDVDLKEDTQGMSWRGVAWELDLNVCDRTLEKTMKQALTWGKYDPCVKELLSPSLCRRRVRWCEFNLDIRPTVEEWKNVRWSDEFHAGLGPEGQLTIFRKRGNAMRGRFDNIQHRRKPTKKQVNHKVHAWAAVGWDFKTDLIFYEPGNSNGAISHEVYVNQILEKEVRKWVEQGDDFVLEQDGAGGHGGGPNARENNPPKLWFEEHGVKYFFNCADSADLAPIENCWQAPKDYCRKIPHWSKAELREILIEGWKHVSYDFINEQVASMPKCV